jgi:hypothetical protein
MAKLVLMTKIKMVVGTVTVAGLATVAVVQHQSLAAQRSDNDALRQRIVELTNQTNRPLQKVEIVKNLSDDQFQELLRLRGEVALLRNRSNQQPQSVAQLNRENQQLKADLDTAQFILRFDATRARVINSLKQVGLAMRVYAQDNNMMFATNFDSMVNELGGEEFKKQCEDQFEFVNTGLVNDTTPQAMMFREKTPRKTPDGRWERSYGLVDGSVQSVVSDDGNFDKWEKGEFAIPAKNP